MKKIILSIALLSAPIIATANNFSMPGFNNGNGYSNGSSWNMPNMNWGNSNNSGFNNGSNWSMPTMNWGNSANNTNGNNFGGNNWNMPTMNWGNSNNSSGYNNGSNWNMPNMNWGNSANNNSSGFNNGSNWTMPTMNWGNGNNNYAPNVQYRAPVMPVAPQFNPITAPRTTVQTQATPIAKKPVVKAVAPMVKTAPAIKSTVENKIPMPSEVKGVILAPTNKTMEIETTK